MLKGAFGKMLGGGGSDSAPNMATPYGRLQAFFREIDNTTGQRRLTLTVGEAEMSFDVAAKKVMRFIEMKPDPEGLGKVAATIERDFDALDGQLKLLAELLTRFVARPGKFDMVSRPSPVNYPAKADGFPSSEWRFACDLYGVAAVDFTKAVPEEGAPAEAAAPESAAEAPAKKPAKAEAPPAPEPAPVPAAETPEEAAVHSVMSALEPTAPAPTPAPVAPKAGGKPVSVEAFYETLAKYCDVAMVLNENGDVVQFTETAAGWFDLGPEIVRDVKAWVGETAALMGKGQVIVLRSPQLQNQSVMFLTDGKLTAFCTFSSHVTGRIFSLAGEYLRPAA